MNLPNKLTLFRIILVPVYLAVALWMPEDYASVVSLKNIILLVIFLIASLTDFLDGYIARRDHLITSFGKFLDPIADKAIIDTALILFAWFHQAWVLPVILMILRDLIVDGLRLSASSQGEVVSAGFAGKLKTVLQMAAIVLILLNNWPFVYLNIPVDQVVLWAATLVSLYSGWIYFKKLKHYVLESM